MDIIFSLFPTTVFDWTLQITLSLLTSLIVLSFVEHIIHGYVMHQRIFPEFVYARISLLTMHLSDHVELHHNTYFKIFNYEPDEVGKRLNMTISYFTVFLGLIGFSPVLLLLAYTVSIVPMLVFAAVLFTHRYLWNTVHREMHQPQYPWWSRLAPYRFLARYHYLHHQSHQRDVHVNFNIVLPFADFVMGRAVLVPTPSQREEMQKFGYLK